MILFKSIVCYRFITPLFYLYTFYLIYYLYNVFPKLKFKVKFYYNSRIIVNSNISLCINSSGDNNHNLSNFLFFNILPITFFSSLDFHQKINKYNTEYLFLTYAS